MGGGDAERRTVWAHTAVFWQYIIVRALMVAVNLREYYKVHPNPNPDLKAKIWIGFYFADSLLLPLLTFLNFCHYDYWGGEEDNTILTPRALNQFVDYFFFFLLGTQDMCLPALNADTIMRETFEIIAADPTQVQMT